ncbi:MAG: NnrS family protein, partial [Pseudomonadota bacterium]|nr:NnrS family protein [Pseudomonadota bacterium]
MRITSSRAFFSQPVFDLAFRPLFLLASLFGIIALLYWGGVWNGWVNPSHALPATLWHGHEMMFGFVGAVLVGFLLTAVQTWTGLRSIHGQQCALLVGFWLVGRIAMWPAVSLPSWLVILLDSSFFIYAGLFLAKLVYQKKQKRNYFAVVVLLLLIFTNINFHLSSQLQQFETASNSLYSAVFLITLMMAVIGGRIIPMFTSNTTQIPARPRWTWLDRAALFSVWLIVAVFFLQLQTWIPASVLAIML